MDTAYPRRSRGDGYHEVSVYALDLHALGITGEAALRARLECTPAGALIDLGQEGSVALRGVREGDLEGESLFG